MQYPMIKASDISATDTSNIVDVTADTLYSVRCVNDTIGCDLPNTVALCLNRLVWAQSSGEVYTLVTTYTSSKRNIYPISRNIERYLKTDGFNNAFAVEWNGYYNNAMNGYILQRVIDEGKRYLTSKNLRLLSRHIKTTER